MTQIDLLRQDVLAEMPRLVPRLKGDLPAPELERKMFKVVGHFHVLAAASLFADAKPAKFFLNLCRAAENWRCYLAFLDEKDQPKPPAFHQLALLGAVASGNWGLAQSIARLAKDQPTPGLEYEEEFLHARLWHHLCLHIKDDDKTFEQALKPWMTQLAACAEGTPAEVVAVLEAVLADDSEDFDSAFETAVMSYEDWVEAKAKNFATPDAEFMPYRNLWLEGLALLRLARQRKMDIEGDFPYCPLLAQGPMPEPYQGDWAVQL